MEGDINLNRLVVEFLTLVDMQGSQAQFTVHLFYFHCVLYASFPVI